MAAMRAERTLAAFSPVAMATTKQLFHEVAELPFAEAMEQGRKTNERMRAFAQKMHK